MAKKHKAKQVEITFDKPEPFKLEVQQTTDGDRVARQAAQTDADKQHAEQQQTKFV